MNNLATAGIITGSILTYIITGAINAGISVRYLDFNNDECILAFLLWPIILPFFIIRLIIIRTYNWSLTYKQSPKLPEARVIDK